MPFAESSLSFSKAPARRRRKAERPAELAAAALDLFVEKGFAATRLDDVAARAGVSKGTLYLYFDHKEALFKAVIEEAIVPLLSAAEQQIAHHAGSAAELLRELLKRWWEEIGDTRLGGVPKLIISESRNFPDLARYYHDTVIARGRSLLRRVLERGVKSGEFRAIDVDSAIEVIFAPLIMLLVWRYSLPHGERKIAPEDYLCTHFDLLVGGLCRQKESS